MKWFTNKARYYNRNATIIIGNSVAGSIPEIFLKNSSADIAVMGEGEITTAEVVRKILRGEQNWEKVAGIAFKNKDGKIYINEKRKGVKKLDEFPMINWENFDTEKYFEKSYAGAHAINDKKGELCLWLQPEVVHLDVLCHFVFWNDPYRYRSPENILLELKGT